MKVWLLAVKLGICPGLYSWANRMLRMPACGTISDPISSWLWDNKVSASSELYWMQAVSVHCPSWANKMLQAPAHITISVARGARAKQAGELVKKVQQGHRFGLVHDPCEHDLRYGVGMHSCPQQMRRCRHRHGARCCSCCTGIEVCHELHVNSLLLHAVVIQSLMCSTFLVIEIANTV